VVEGVDTMLWILALPALAVILMLVYVLGYRAGMRVADRAARYREEAIRERRYCGTGLMRMEVVKVADEIRRPERMDDDV
jgi:hypothetical protein